MMVLFFTIYGCSISDEKHCNNRNKYVEYCALGYELEDECSEYTNPCETDEEDYDYYKQFRDCDERWDLYTQCYSEFVDEGICYYEGYNDGVMYDAAPACCFFVIFAAEDFKDDANSCFDKHSQILMKYNEYTGVTGHGAANPDTSEEVSY